jgi:hypothetical protein
MAVIVANVPLVLTVPAGFRLQFGTPISGVAMVTLPGRILNETLTDGEGLGPYQSDASISITSTVSGTCYTIRRDGPAAIVQSAHLGQVPNLLGASVFVGEDADGPTVSAGWAGSQYLATLPGDGTPQGVTPLSVATAAAKTLPEGSTSKTNPGVQLRQVDGTNSYMVATEGYGKTPKACTVTWTAGNVATITITGGDGLHECVEQDAFVLQVASPGTNSTNNADAVWAQVLRVAAVTNGSTLTVRLPFTPAAGPVSAVTFQRCTRNITVDLDLDYNFAGNNTAGANPNRMAVILAFLADSTVRVRGKDVFKYLVLAAGCDNVAFDVGSMPNAHSDTFKGYGPMNNCTIKVFGQAGEDCVSLQALEPPNFIGYMPCQGNIRNTRIRGISARVTTGGSAPVVVYADPVYNISGTVIEDGESVATAGTGHGLNIRAGTVGGGSGFAFAPVMANLSDVTYRNMEASSAGGDSFALQTPMQRLRFENCVIRAPGLTSQRGVYLNDAVDVLEFNGMNFSLDNWAPAAGNAFMRNVARAKTVRFNACRIRGKAATTVLRFILMDGASAQCDSLEFNNFEIADMDLLGRFELTMAAAPQVALRGGVSANVLTIANFRRAGGVLILDGATITGASNGVCRSEGSGVVSTVYGFATLLGSSKLAVSVNGGKVNLRTPFIPFDVSVDGAALNPVSGQQFTAAATLGAIPAGLPVTTRALTFTGALTAATSGTLAGNFAEPSGSYPVLFSDGSYRLVALVSGAATASWAGAVTATASAVYVSAT